MIRRHRAAPVTLAVLVVMSPLAEGAELAFGVAAGEVTSDSALLWAKSVTSGLMTFEYSASQDFATVLGAASVLVSDAAIAAKAGLTGLAAGSQYWYRATDAAGDRSVGTFRTAAAANASTGLRFGVSGDWQAELRPYSSIGNAPGRNLDFFVKLGDTIYAENYFAAGTPTASTLAEYRTRYDLGMTAAGGANTWPTLNASTAVWATIDDHEVVNDFQGGADPVADAARFPNPAGADYINQTPRYQAGIQAFTENMPLGTQTYAGTGDARMDGAPKLYREQTYGNAASLMLLDARSFRDPGLPAANPSDPVSVGTYLATSQQAPRTMLGSQQLSDLKADLVEAQQSGVTWKFVMLPEPIQNLGILNASDRFEGYANERRDLLKWIKDNGVENVVFVSADIHGTLVNEVYYRDSAFGPEIASGAWEISTGAVAFDAPFGPTVVELAYQLGLTSLSPAIYATLAPAQKEAVIQQIVNASTGALGYDALGLEDLGARAALLQGGYTATNSFGWTEFEIDPVSKKLRVTTYGIDAGTYASISADPAAFAALQPAVVSRFEVTPVPEPRTTLLLAAGLACLLWAARGRQRGRLRDITAR